MITNMHSQALLILEEEIEVALNSVNALNNIKLEVMRKLDELNKDIDAKLKYIRELKPSIEALKNGKSNT